LDHLALLRGAVVLAGLDPALALAPVLARAAMVGGLAGTLALARVDPFALHLGSGRRRLVRGLRDARKKEPGHRRGHERTRDLRVHERPPLFRLPARG